MNPVGCTKLQTAQPICGSRPGFKEPFGFSLLIESILSKRPLSKKTLMKLEGSKTGSVRFLTKKLIKIKI
jgi:hypothetical protein